MVHSPNIILADPPSFLHRYYCLAAAAALLKYAEFIQHMMFAPNSIRVSYKGSEHTTMIGTGSHATMIGTVLAVTPL